MPTDTTVQFDFSEALKALRQGKRVRRLEWDVHFYWIELAARRFSDPTDVHLFIARSPGECEYSGWIGCEADILATDWVVVEEKVVDAEMIYQNERC